ncbi:MAG: hypothetical protein LBG43_07140 [Treponema sp.]|jgi:phosphotransferase system enzyme I (PtsI)|nr:hypothetical protein [Treponema sp.]
MITLQGKGVSSGIAKGRLSFLKRESLSVEKRRIDDVEREIERFNTARQSASEQLDTLAATMADKIGEENALLFEIHRMMLGDTDFCEPIVEIIKTEKVCAEYAVNTAGSRLAQEFAGMDDDYMKARSIDVYDISKRAIEMLSGKEQGRLDNDDPVILAVDDFTPSETAQLDRSKVYALVSRQGAANSHTAIFARTMGIPAIIGFGAVLSGDLSGKDAALDGETGVLYIDPEPTVIKELDTKPIRSGASGKSLNKRGANPLVPKTAGK